MMLLSSSSLLNIMKIPRSSSESPVNAINTQPNLIPRLIWVGGGKKRAGVHCLHMLENHCLFSVFYFESWLIIHREVYGTDHRVTVPEIIFYMYI